MLPLEEKAWPGINGQELRPYSSLNLGPNLSLVGNTESCLPAGSFCRISFHFGQMQILVLVFLISHNIEFQVVRNVIFRQCSWHVTCCNFAA